MADVSATGQIVINDYKLKPPSGTKECDAASIEKGYQNPQTQMWVATDVLQLYFFGTRSYDNGKVVFDVSAVDPKLVSNLPVEAKNALLQNPAFLGEVYQKLAAANDGSIANLFNQDKTARDKEYGDKLYTCGAKDRWFWENPNRNAIGAGRALWLTKDRWFNNEIGSLPNRKVPYTEILGVIAKYTAPPAAPQPAANVAPPVISGIKPAAVAVGTGAKSVVIKGANLEGAQLSVTDDNCKDAITMESIKNEAITLRILTGTLEGAPKKCNISVANQAGEASADLGVKNKGTGKPKPPSGSDVCKTNPEVCL